MFLSYGRSGPAVKELQEQLQQLGFYNLHKIDGVFGPKTRRAVSNFQMEYLVDGIVDDITKETISTAVTAWCSKTTLPTFLPVPKGLQGIQETFGTIEYEDTGSGYVVVTNSWEAKNIVHAKLPIVGTHAVHMKILPVLIAVLEKIKDRGLDREIETFWCWSPRHKMHDVRFGLSTHSWGIACDINAASNQPGILGDMHNGIVKVFEQHGFEWGGRWKKQDFMHFQYATNY